LTLLRTIRCNQLAFEEHHLNLPFRSRKQPFSTLRTLLACGLAGLLLVGSAAPAFADRIDDLSRTLEREKDEKARIAAAVGLGRIADERAVPVLIRALRDPSAVVRGVAASALGHIGDSRAVPALEKLLADGSEPVRARAKEALAAIRDHEARLSNGGQPVSTSYVAPRERPLLAGPASESPRLFVSVKSISNKTDNGGKPFADKMREFLVNNLGESPEITLDSALATDDHLSRFTIDGAITSMSKTSSARYVELRCEVQISISNSKGKILSIVTGGATLQVPRASWRDAAEKNLWQQALENAVRGAHQNLVTYMTRQLAQN
jgi:hypothetical protein